MVTISQTESRTINTLRFLCLLCVVMIHCGAHGQPEAIARVSDEVYQTAKQCHAFYTSLPSLQILFILSGYLFFRNMGDSWDWPRDYLGKLKSRLVSIVLPYLAWSVLYFIYQIIRHKGGDGVLTPSYFLEGLWPLSYHGKLLVPVFWFLRALICFTLFSPLYYLVCRVCKHLTPLLCVVVILSPLPFDFVYFNAYLLLGAYFAYSGFTLTGIGRLFPWKTAMVLAVVCSGLTIFLPPPISSKALNIILLAIWLPALLGATEGTRLPSFCSPAAGMFLYASHFYVCIFLGVRCVRNLPLNLLWLNADMWISFIGATVLLLALFALVSRSPRLTFLLTGGRTAS